jgi:HEAT repeat protein
VRVVAVEQLGKNHGDEEIAKRLEKIYKDDKAYSVRGAALQSLALDKAPNAAAILQGALAVSAPDDVMRSAALRAMGSLGDDSVVPALIEWSSPGKPSALRGIAIGSLGRVDLKNHEITTRLISYLNESSFDIRFAAIFALGRRGDPTAVEPLEALLKTGQLSIGVPHAVEDLIAQLKGQGAPSKGPSAADSNNGNAAANNSQEVLDRLDRLEQQLTEMSNRLRHIEAGLPGSKSD